MPYPCFSYPADVPPGTRTRAAVQSAQCGLLSCFSYPAEVPPGTRTRAAAQSAQCGYLHCFSYPADTVQPTAPELHTMPHSCFRY